MRSHYPRLLLDEAICRRNIRRMAEKAKKNQVTFRPHFKTHQSGTIGRWFREEGVSAITVSSVKMALYFATEGWDDIFIAFPASLPEIDTIDHLARSIRLNLSVESVKTAEYLKDHLSEQVGIYLKIDTGYHRTGLDPEDITEITGILEVIGRAPNLRFIGFYTHSGHTYQANNTTEIENIHIHSIQVLARLRDTFQKDHPGLLLSIGDTPSCSFMEKFGPVEEIRPGNFVFYDLMQEKLGVCTLEDVALVLECPVVAKNRIRNELVIHGGAVHLSKEFIMVNGEVNYGRVVRLTESGWAKPVGNTYVKNLSQEHGIILTDRNYFDSIQIGETLGILPVHSCLTANLADHYLTGTGEVITKMRS